MSVEHTELSPSVTMTWTYRIAQNPRWVWLACVPPFLLMAAWSVAEFVTEPARSTLSSLPIGIAMAGVAALFPTVGGFTHLGSTEPPRIATRRIRPAGIWTLHLPVLLVTTGVGTFALLEYLEPHTTIGSRFTPGPLLASAILLLGVTVLSFLVLGHRRRLRFTTHALEYERGRFRATIPWDAIVDLQPVCDANIKTGGLGRVHRPSRRNLRAGVQLVVDDTVETRRKTMLFRIDGRDVIGVDCSSYRIDPNTLINAIHLMVERPELRTLLDTPEGSELFRGPSWNTRRKMRVGDTWDRHTDQIIPASVSESS